MIDEQVKRFKCREMPSHFEMVVKCIVTVLRSGGNILMMVFFFNNAQNYAKFIEQVTHVRAK